jgi:hypothetical protein
LPDVGNFKNINDRAQREKDDGQECKHPPVAEINLNDFSDCQFWFNAPLVHRSSADFLCTKLLKKLKHSLCHRFFELACVYSAMTIKPLKLLQHVDLFG